MIDGYPLADYQFSAATFAVPDQLVYFAARAAVGSHAVALPVWVAALFLLLTATAIWAGCELLPDRRRAVVAVGLAGGAGYLGWNAAVGFVHPHNDLLLPVWHNGALTVALAGFAAALRLVRAAGRRAVYGWTAAVGGLAAAGLFSDRFVGIYLILPTAAVLFAGWWRGDVPRRRLLGWLLATAGGGLAGLAALRLFQGAADPIDNYWKTPDLGRLADRASRLVRVLGDELLARNPLLVGAAGWYALAVAAGLRRLVRPASPSAVGAVRLLSVVMLAGVTGAFLLSAAADDFLAALDWAVFSRYFVGPVGAAYLGWGVWLAGTRRLWPVAPFAAAAVIGFAAALPPVVARLAREWYPEVVRAVDEACRVRGLTAGLGGYGDAKPHTLLSRAGVTVRPVRLDRAATAGAVSFPWLGNAGWYTRGPGGGPAGFQFVLVGGTSNRDGPLPESVVVGRLGEPAERVPVGDRVLLVYDRPDDWRLRRFGGYDLPTLNRRHERFEEPVTYPGAALMAYDPAAVTDTPDGGRIVIEGRAASGIAVHGPYLAVGRPGWYRATFRLSAAADADEPVGHVDVTWSAPDGLTAEVVNAAEVRPTGDQEVELKLLMKPRHRGGKLEFRLSYAGQGQLTLRDVRFERLARPGR